MLAYLALLAALCRCVAPQFFFAEVSPYQNTKAEVETVIRLGTQEDYDFPKFNLSNRFVADALGIVVDPTKAPVDLRGTASPVFRVMLSCGRDGSGGVRQCTDVLSAHQLSVLQGTQGESEADRMIIPSRTEMLAYFDLINWDCTTLATASLITVSGSEWMVITMSFGGVHIRSTGHPDLRRNQEKRIYRYSQLLQRICVSHVITSRVPETPPNLMKSFFSLSLGYETNIPLGASGNTTRVKRFILGAAAIFYARSNSRRIDVNSRRISQLAGNLQALKDVTLRQGSYIEQNGNRISRLANITAIQRDLDFNYFERRINDTQKQVQLRFSELSKDLDIYRTSLAITDRVTIFVEQMEALIESYIQLHTTSVEQYNGEARKFMSRQQRVALALEMALSGRVPTSVVGVGEMNETLQQSETKSFYAAYSLSRPTSKEDISRLLGSAVADVIYLGQDRSMYLSVSMPAFRNGLEMTLYSYNCFSFQQLPPTDGLYKTMECPMNPEGYVALSSGQNRYVFLDDTDTTCTIGELSHCTLAKPEIKVPSRMLTWRECIVGNLLRHLQLPVGDMAECDARWKGAPAVARAAVLPSGVVAISNPEETGEIRCDGSVDSTTVPKSSLALITIPTRCFLQLGPIVVRGELASKLTVVAPTIVDITPPNVIVPVQAEVLRLQISYSEAIRRRDLEIFQSEEYSTTSPVLALGRDFVFNKTEPPVNFLLEVAAESWKQQQELAKEIAKDKAHLKEIYMSPSTVGCGCVPTWVVPVMVLLAIMSIVAMVMSVCALCKPRLL